MPLQGSTYQDFIENNPAYNFYIWRCKTCKITVDRGNSYCPDCEDQYTQLHDAEVDNFGATGETYV
jgi:rubrerythrin